MTTSQQTTLLIKLAASMAAYCTSTFQRFEQKLATLRVPIPHLEDHAGWLASYECERGLRMHHAMRGNR